MGYWKNWGWREAIPFFVAGDPISRKEVSTKCLVWAALKQKQAPPTTVGPAYCTPIHIDRLSVYFRPPQSNQTGLILPDRSKITATRTGSPCINIAPSFKLTFILAQVYYF